jgi:hypothetical protein
VIWSGFGLSGGSAIYDFRLCMYNDRPHFCYLTGKQEGGYSRGHMNILDLTFSVVKQVRPQNGKAPNDQHETNLSYDRKSALISIYNSERADLSAYGVGGQGWVQNTMFQRINIDTGELEFEWDPMDHISISDSFVAPNLFTTLVVGHHRDGVYDWLHLNAIDENSDGDYYLSARHTNALYKISGIDGSLIWTLGGISSDFEFDEGLNFSSQHHVRVLSHNASTEILCIFDNGSDGIRITAAQSSGMILKVDHTTTPPFVSLLKSFHPPRDQNISDSQGSLQIYNPEDWETSHAFVCWGSQPAVNEYDADGNIIFSARLQHEGAASYRGYKFDFDTDPFDNPALYSYARTFESSTVYHMSWNGATRVRAWRIWGRSICDEDDGWKVVHESTPKMGFETTFIAKKFYDYTMVEALDADGNGLKNSSTKGTKTFVPGEWLAEICDEEGCPVANDTFVEHVPKSTARLSDLQRKQRCRPHGWKT